MADYIDKTIKFYNDFTEDYIQNTISLQDKDWLKKFTSFIPAPAKILDLGCAFGRDTQTFVDKGYDAFGVDLSEKMIAEAKKRVPKATFFVMNLLKLDFNSEFFDGVWCSAVLHHISKKDMWKAMKEIHRVLKLGGYLYFSVKLGEGEGLMEDKRYQGAEKFYAYFGKEETEKLLKDYGFEIVEFFSSEEKYSSYSISGSISVIAKKV